jgi:predicted transcriptional regulator
MTDPVTFVASALAGTTVAVAAYSLQILRRYSLIQPSRRHAGLAPPVRGLVGR